MPTKVTITPKMKDDEELEARLVTAKLSYLSVSFGTFLLMVS